MRERLANFRLTPAGGGLVLVLGAAVAVLVVGPSGEQVPAIVVIVIVAMMLLVQPGGTRRAWSRTLQERAEDFNPPQRRGEDAPLDEAEQDALWAEERGRRGR